MIFCPNCGKQNIDHAKFCKFCGNHLYKNLVGCPKCGTENSDYAKFCKICGNKLKEELKLPAPPAPVKEEAPTAAPAAPEKEKPSSFVGEPIKLRPGMRVLTIEETGEIMEEIEEKGEEEGLHVLSDTFAETLEQLARSREELAQIEERIAEALKVQREREEETLREMTATYELTQKKIQALEELSALRRLQSGEIKLAKLFRGEIPDIEGGLFEEEREEEVEEDLEDIEDLEDLDELEDYDEDLGGDDFLEEDDEFDEL